MKAFADTLFSALRQMDAEASGLFNGAPTGLNFYGGHYRPKLKRPPTETSWTRRIAELLTAAGYPTRTEFHYPGTKLRCDNVVTMPDGTILWLENKGCWKQYWIDQGGVGIYQSYLLHPLKPGLLEKSHTVPRDLAKLRKLAKPIADRVAYLLLGFDSETAPMLGDIDELVKLAGLDTAPWIGFSRSWQDVYRPGKRNHAWLWTADVI
jgi:hypothetical protein